MSDFASLLNSFKQNAASASAPASLSQSKSPAKPTGGAPVNNREERQHNASKYSAAPAKWTTSGALTSSAQFQRSTRKRRLPPSISLSSFELSFLVIGGQKCGTTWLHNLLQQCNRIALPFYEKEVHFWDWHYHKGFDWYMHQFGLSQKKQQKSEPLKPKLLYGEITPCYVVLPIEKIEEIFQCFPRLKIIFVARDLVDRVWSALIMELRDQTLGLNPGEFADGVGVRSVESGRGSKNASTMSVAQQRRMQQLSSPSSQTDSYFIERLQHATHNSRSDYATHLNHWYDHFPPNAILIIDFKEIGSDPRGVLLKIVKHIGVDDTDAKNYVDSLDEKDVRQRVNVATNSNADCATAGAISSTSLGTLGKEPEVRTQSSSSRDSLSHRPRLRKQMEEYLRPYAVKFNALLKEQGYTWRLDDYSD